MEWKFKEIKPSDTKVDPSHLEFFRDKALDEIVSALVREDIQNRLDARLNNKNPVRIRYHLSGDTLQADPAKWFIGLDEHLNAKNSLVELKVNKPFDLLKKVPYLTIECFNTTGLRGDPLQSSDPENETKQNRNDFYWFIRNVGRTGKKGNDRGRWGLGKIVYPAASMIRSFFCYSIKEDRTSLFIGRSVLAIHRIEKNEYVSEGYYACFNDQSEDPYYAVPEQHQKQIDPFIKSFNVKRNPDESGTSLVIPYPHSSITKENLVLWILKSYFLEILRGTLEVSVSEGLLPSCDLNKDTISNIVGSWSGLTKEDKVNMQQRLLFCRKAEKLNMRGDNPPYFYLSPPSSYGTPNIEQLFTEGDLERATKLYRDGEVLGFEIQINITKECSPADASLNKQETGSFFVFLQKDPDLTIPDETFIRDGLTIINEHYIKENGVRALTLAEHKPVNIFLGDAENPAHTSWDSKTKHFNYVKGKATLSYIQTIALKLSKLLGKVENVTMDDLLVDFFSVPDETSDIGHGKRRRGKKKPVPEIPPLERRRYCETSKIAGNFSGFKVFPASNATSIPDQIEINMAYEIEGVDDPFKYYHPADFNISGDSNMSIVTENCSIRESNYNHITIDSIQQNYTISVVGFDPKRDLKVNVKPVLKQVSEIDGGVEE